MIFIHICLYPRVQTKKPVSICLSFISPNNNQIYQRIMRATKIADKNGLLKHYDDLRNRVFNRNGADETPHTARLPLSLYMILVGFGVGFSFSLLP